MKEKVPKLMKMADRMKWHRIEIVGRKRLSKPEPYIGCSAL
jgi:hypothetical protein